LKPTATKPKYITPSALQRFISSALKEDIGNGDHTTLACIPPKKKVKAKLIVKDEGIIAGVEMAKFIFKKIDKNLILKISVRDGEDTKLGDIAFIVEGKAQSIVTGERLVLNCMQRMSGIATKTSQLVSICRKTRVRILDTRKTTPGFRMLEKWAVKIGGGENHRFGLFDMILIKDNHVDYCGGIKNAILSTNDYLKRKKKKLKIEVEVRNMKELSEALSVGKINRILLDNFSLEQMKEAVKQVNKKFETEASGGINESNIRAYAETGVDFISIGALTHSFRSLDMSLKAF